MRRSATTALAALAALTALTVAAATAAASPRRPATRLSPLPSNVWVPDGAVTSVVRFRGKLVIAGAFSSIGRRTGPIARVSAATGALRPGFPAFAGGDVTAIVDDGHGGWYVGGAFLDAGGLARPGLAHVLASGRVDPAFAARPTSLTGSGAIAQLALIGSTLYVAGDFDHLGGAPRAGLAAADATTGRTTPWQPALPPESTVAALAVRGTTLYVGGQFTRIAGAPRTDLAAFDGMSGALAPWAPVVHGDDVGALATSSTAVYVGGGFDRIDGQGRTGLAALDPLSGAVLPWDPANAIRRESTALATVGNVVLSAEVDSTGAEQVFSYGADAAIHWVLDVDGPVASVVTDGHAVYLVGSFLHVGHARVARNGVAAVDLGTRRVLAWNPPLRVAGVDFGETAKVVKPTGDGVLVGGGFVAVGGVARAGLAAVDPVTGAPSAWSPHPDGQVGPIVASDDRLYVAGNFRHVAGARRSGSAAFDSRFRLTRWRLAGVSVDTGVVTSLAVSGRHVVAAGSFQRLPRAMGAVAAFDRATGALDRSFTPRLGTTGLSWQLVARGPRIVVRGDFRRNVAVLDARTGRVLSYPLGPTGASVSAIAVHGSRLYVGGTFTRIRGLRRHGLAALSLTTNAVLSWRASVDGAIASIATDGWTVVVAGAFEHVGRTPRQSVAALAARGGALLRFDPRPSDTVQAVQALLDRVGVVLYGAFRAVGPVPEAGLAVLRG